LRQILVKIAKNFYGEFSDVARVLWRGLFESYAMLRVVPGFQIRQNANRRVPKSGRNSTSMNDDHVEKMLAVIRKIRRISILEFAEEV
jgi:hypothetical protein